MPRDVTKLLTSEMNKEEWTEFRRQWIDDFTSGYVVECGMELKEAEELSEIQFERYCGQEGYTGRNERICMLREIESGTEY